VVVFPQHCVISWEVLNQMSLVLQEKGGNAFDNFETCGDCRYPQQPKSNIKQKGFKRRTMLERSISCLYFNECIFTEQTMMCNVWYIYIYNSGFGFLIILRITIFIISDVYAVTSTFFFFTSWTVTYGIGCVV